MVVEKERNKETYLVAEQLNLNQPVYRTKIDHPRVLSDGMDIEFEPNGKYIRIKNFRAKGVNNQ